MPTVSEPAPVSRRRYPRVERRAGLDRETLAREYMAKNRPVVIGAQDQAWCERWSLDAIVSRYGDCDVDAEETREVYVGERALVSRPLGPMIGAMRRGDRSVRWKGLEFLARVPAIRRDLDRSPAPTSALFPESMFDARSTLWIAPQGTMSSLHHDGNFDNLNLQVSGRKLWLLVPPPSHHELHFHGSAESPVNPFAPDLARFPRFAGATPLEALLEPGDTILVPKYWWHCVYAVEPSVNLATCFRWSGEPRAWSVLKGAPLAHRSLTVLSAEMKRRGLVGLANATRRAWCKMHELTVPRVTPQPRCELLDP